MLPDRYLIAGLDAISRAYDAPTPDEGFGNGHRGAAVVAAYYMFKDGLAEAQAEAPIQAMVDYYLQLPLFAPMAPEPAAPLETDRLLSALLRAFGTDQAHGVIFTSLAMRAFSQRPDLITHSRIEGLLRMIAAYTPKEPPDEPLHDQPYAADLFANHVLGAFAASAHLHEGFFQGCSGHILTFAQAVHDLYALGHIDLARKAEMGCRAHCTKCLLGPSRPDTHMVFPVQDPQPQLVRPGQAGFWLSYKAGPEFAKGLGHIIKYAYAFNALSQRATDSDTLARARKYYYLAAWG